MHMSAKTLVAALFLATASLPGQASIPTGIQVDFSDVFSRGNLFSDANNVVEYTLGAGVDDYLTQIDFSAVVQANPLLSLGTTFTDLSVEVRYQDATSDLAVNLGFDVGNIDAVPADAPAALAGSLEQVADTPYQFSGWRVRTGGKFTFTFYEEFDDANFDGLENADYWDAQWQSGSSLGLVTTPVPEPETYAMMLAGLAVLGWAARRRV